MNSFLLNVAHLTDIPTDRRYIDQYEVEVFHMVGLLFQIKARPVVYKYVNPDKLEQECQAAINSLYEAPTLSRQTIAV